MRDNRRMKTIDFENSLFNASTYGPAATNKPSLTHLANPFIVRAGQNMRVGVETRDAVPLIFACPGYIGAAKITLEDATKEVFRDRMHAAITQYNLDPRKIQVYIGPCLTFSHTFVERPMILDMMDRGYRIACKRTDGVDFLDVPVVVLMQCRHLGIPMENIVIGDFDTFENPELLYSKLRGDRDYNLTVATLK